MNQPSSQKERANDPGRTSIVKPILTNQTTQTINLLASPDYLAFLANLRQVLAGYPEALEAVSDALDGKPSMTLPPRHRATAPGRRRCRRVQRHGPGSGGLGARALVGSRPKSQSSAIAPGVTDCGILTLMKLKLPRRRWLLLISCLAAVLVIMYGVDAQRYQGMLARYERVRVGMSPSEVRAAIGQPSVVCRPVPPPFIDEDRLRATVGEQPVRAKAPEMSADIWVDHNLTMDVSYAEGKVLDKSLDKGSFAEYWVDRLLGLFGYCLKT